MKERILFISHRIPYPPNKGDKIRSYNILQFLCNNYDIDLAFLIDNKHDLQYINSLQPLVKKLDYEIINPRLKKLYCLATLFKNDTISVPFFYSSRLQKKIDTWISQHQPDHVFCFSSPTAEYIFRSRHYNSLKKVNLIMDLIDVDSLKWRQYAEKITWPMSLLYCNEASGLARYEAKIVKRFRHVLLVSKPEKAILSENCDGNIHAISNGVDLLKFSPDYQTTIELDYPAIVFTGAMDYWPNIEGIVWFAKEILPQVKEKIPGVTLYIVGSNPSVQITNLAREDFIEVTGFVDDIRDYLAAATLCVAPLRVARGIQNKVLEGMAMGKAVVCTPQALEGIEATGGKDVQVAETAAEFTQAVIALLNDNEKCIAMGGNARKRMEEGYSWQHNLASLGNLLEVG